jgi:CRISPR-associated endonuclease Csn1
LETITVSYKRDHGLNGKMFNETAYGLITSSKQDPDLPGYGLVTRKKIDSLSEKEITAIRNRGWRTRVEDHVKRASDDAGKKLNKTEFAKALADFGKNNNVKTIRILVSNQSATPIVSAPWKAYAPESFVCVDIWQIPKGKAGRWKKGEYEWKGAFWSYAQCKGEVPQKNDGQIQGRPIHPAAKYITRLFKNDLIELVEGGQPMIVRVAGFSTTNNKIDLRPQYATDGKQAFVSINAMRINFQRKLLVSEDGRLRR